MQALILILTTIALKFAAKTLKHHFLILDLSEQNDVSSTLSNVITKLQRHESANKNIDEGPDAFCLSSCK